MGDRAVQGDREIVAHGYLCSRWEHHNTPSPENSEFHFGIAEGFEDENRGGAGAFSSATNHHGGMEDAEKMENKYMSVEEHAFQVLLIEMSFK